MTVVGMVFLVFGFSLSVAMSTARNTWVPTWMFVYHALCSVGYWSYALQYGGDSDGYYTYPIDLGFAPGTEAVGYITAVVRDVTGGSYLDFFMWFHLAGWAGLVFLFDLLSSIANGSPHLERLKLLVVFLPGLNFWTSAIGKDAVACLGIMMFLKSVHSANRLGVGAIGGLAIGGIVRPHIALLLGGSWGLAQVFASKTHIALRVITIAALGAAAVVAAPFVAQYIGLGGLDAAAVDDFVANRQLADLDGGSAVDISQYPYPLQFFTFMFRPLFVDANGLFGLVVSAENALYLGLFVWALPRMLGTLWGARSTDFAKMNLIIWFAGVSVLGATIGNFGLAIRQKCMVLPSFFILVFTALAVERQARARTVAAVKPPVTRGRIAARQPVLTRQPSRQS